MIQEICKVESDISKRLELRALECLTLSNAPPGQCHIGEKCIERRGLLPAILLPEVEGLREASTGPQGIIGAIVELCKENVQQNSVKIVVIQQPKSYTCIIDRKYIVKFNLLAPFWAHRTSSKCWCHRASAAWAPGAASC